MGIETIWCFIAHEQHKNMLPHDIWFLFEGFSCWLHLLLCEAYHNGHLLREQRSDGLVSSRSVWLELVTSERTVSVTGKQRFVLD